MEAYYALVAGGGLPSHPVTLGYDVIDNPGRYEQYKDILWFWHFGGGGDYSEFRRQLIEWKEFREYQDRKRRYYVPRKRFQEYENLIRESQADANCNWHLRVLEDRHQQSRLEDWNEFRALYYRRLKAHEKLVPPAEQEFLLYQKKYEDAQARLTDVITDPKVLYSRFKEIRASEKEMVEARSRLRSAKKALQAAKRSKSTRKTTLIKTAQRELHSAKDNLTQVSGSEEMRRLRDGYDLHIAQDAAAHAGGGLRAAQLYVKRWKVFLKWIDDQYPTIAAECGCFTSGMNNVSLTSPGEKENSQSVKVRLQARQRRHTRTRSILSPNASSRVSKPSKRKGVSSRLRATTTTQLPLADSPQEAVQRVSVVTSVQQGDDGYSDRKSWVPRRRTNSTLQPTRRSARVAERVKGLQHPSVPSETVRTMSKNAQQLSGLKPQKEKTLNGATTNSGERPKGRHPSKPQGVTKRKSRPG